MVLANDTRGWILTCVSGVACTVGASIICIDLLVQRLPGQRNFRIQDSNGFLAGALSLSFGVMLFSALNTMLPEARDYLQKGGLSDRLAAWVNIVCFLGGVIGIQAFSRVLHHFIPSNVVDCDHTHEGDVGEHGHHNHREHRNVSAHITPTSMRESSTQDERTPLISRSQSALGSSRQKTPVSRDRAMEQRPGSRSILEHPRRPTLQPRLTSRMATFITGSKSSCDKGGPCYGYSDPCGMECFKVAGRTPTLLSGRSHAALPRQTSLQRSKTNPHVLPKQELDPASHESALMTDCQSGYSHRRLTIDSTSALEPMHNERDGAASKPVDLHRKESSRRHETVDLERAESDDSTCSSSTANEPTHHHHVPENAFYSIGLQTSLAIALHKLPEGFITYATNHANPELGFSVFMALFIHNFTEGFAMALPMYLALKNRFRAMVISSVLGGISQPLGAAIAALWFQLAGSGDKGPGETVYGCMFSITAGIMASVALQLFSESLTLTHNRHLCTIFAFVGMAILQISHALTA